MIGVPPVVVQKDAGPRAVAPTAVQPIAGAQALAAVRAVAISPVVPVMPDVQKLSN